MFFDELLKLGGIVFTGKRIRVVAVGQKADFNVHSFFQQHVNTTDGGFDAGHVTVVEYSNVIGKTVDKAYLAGSQRSSGRSDHIFHT